MSRTREEKKNRIERKGNVSWERQNVYFCVDRSKKSGFFLWFIARRGVIGEAKTIEAIAKYVPFFGLAAYLMLRPKLPAERVDP